MSCLTGLDCHATRGPPWAMNMRKTHDRDALASGVCQRSCRLVSSITHERVLALQARCGQAVPTG